MSDATGETLSRPLPRDEIADYAATARQELIAKANEQGLGQIETLAMLTLSYVGLAVSESDSDGKVNSLPLVPSDVFHLVRDDKLGLTSGHMDRVDEDIEMDVSAGYVLAEQLFVDAARAGHTG